MEWWSRLVGGAPTPAHITPKASISSDPQARLSRFKRTFNHILALCNKPRQPENEQPLLYQLKTALDRLAVLIREESRASIPHVCLTFAASSQLYTVVSRAAIVSQYEPIISSAVAIFAALVDSEEEDLLSTAPFAKSLMRLVTKVVDSNNVLIGIETETDILELLFTISAKIRLQPEILAVWFRSTARPDLEDVFVKEKRSFVGITQRDDFPLCYIMIDRVHNDGRIGDFARTGLLYIFEATGRSMALEEWVISSDLSTLMASGLGALYSQLSRELSILHPDATLPAVLAMSDYSTTHPRATAESAFSERHQAHMVTFLSYLAFWQDVLDHCRSADVKQTLLDHFQILFLQQLLYPSLLQSSDTDAGSSVAVLTYLCAMLEELQYPDLVEMMLAYLLNIRPGALETVPSTPVTPVRPGMPPRSPTTQRRRQSLMLLTAPKDPEEAMEPSLFNLTDLVLNSARSSNAQTIFAALRLITTMLNRQRKYMFGTLLRTRKESSIATIPEDGPAPSLGRLQIDSSGYGVHHVPPSQTVGAHELMLSRYTDLVVALYGHVFPGETYESVCEDTRYYIEAQAITSLAAQDIEQTPNSRTLPRRDPLLRALTARLENFFTDSLDVNLALTQTLITMASCIELRLDSWVTLDPAVARPEQASEMMPRPWHTHLGDDERASGNALRAALQPPVWSDDIAPALYTTLQHLLTQVEHVRKTIPSLDSLLASRQHMLQASSTPEVALSAPPSLASSPMTATTSTSYLDAVQPSRNLNRSRDGDPLSADRSHKATNRPAVGSDFSVSNARHIGANMSSVSGTRPATETNASLPGSSLGKMKQSMFRPPPPEVPSTTDMLMEKITFTGTTEAQAVETDGEAEERSASLNHVLTNIVVLQQFVLEIVAVIQVRAAVLGERELRFC
ncbi:hypothetical protein LTR78_003843 [Recurvomyces mirabilis]|uniref:Uncharacterized protein n=1 Tax=Recurvomyces mirabilis TaxID=574656 RepID=A0AAE1C2W8_9PEZI|nr:hypothetical protein LTR78_003843 [Recurvomyces mirabilis]KAK5154018.1 hypothetical protein LTS14_007238 [Recurvomyces mirabilis]